MRLMIENNHKEVAEESWDNYSLEELRTKAFDAWFEGDKDRFREITEEIMARQRSQLH